MSKDPNQLRQLLPEYRSLATYSDRLAFWEHHELTEELCYYAREFSDEDGGKEYIDFNMKLWMCQTWQETTAFEVLTLAPFTMEERRQFVEWALPLRPEYHAEWNLDWRKANFWERWRAIERKEDFFEHELKEAQDRASDKINNERQSPAKQRMWFRMFGLGKKFAKLFNQHGQIDNVQIEIQMPLKEARCKWEVIDTYLQAESNYRYAGFLEGFIGSPREQEYGRKPIYNDEQQDIGVKLTHSQIALLYFYRNQQITKNNAPSIATKYGQTSGKKLFDTYNRFSSASSERTGYRFSKRDITTVIGLLGDEKEAVERATADIKMIPK